MEQARCDADCAVDGFPNCRVWTFEEMPASSESPRDRYLRAAADSDFVIWLVGKETSEAVVEEIDACISVKGRLLAFMLPAETRDEQTQQFVGKVNDSAYATWRAIDDPADLANEIQAALSDEITRLVLNPEPPGRRHKLKDLHRESLARCRRSLTTLGISDDIADEIALDASVGHELIVPTAGHRLVVGGQGVGKTLAVERLFQKAIGDALGDSSKPFPIFVRARDLSGPLRDYVEMVTQGYSFTTAQGALVGIDGLDEVGTANANRLLEDVIPYVEANPNITAVVTTRPLPGLRFKGPTIDVPVLDQQGVLQLISKVAGRPVESNELRSWPPALQDAAKHPLFAIMIGAELRKDAQIVGTNASELVDRMVQSALRRSGDHQEEIDELLQELAVKAVCRGEAIPSSDIHRSRTIHSRLIDSRLVIEETGKVDFALPIFREWFAARALVEGKASLSEIHPIADRWIFPIAIAINSESHDLGRDLMAGLARSDPGLAGQVLEEVATGWFGTDDGEELPEEIGLEFGQEIRRAMEDWASGLGPLMPAIGPVTEDGDICTLGIELSSRMIDTAWYRGADRLNPVVRLPKHIRPFSGQYDPDWAWWSGRTIPPTRDWPWAITKDMLVSSLSEPIESRRLALQSPDAIRELTLDFARSVTSWRLATRARPNISEVLRYIDEEAAELASLRVGGSLYLAEDIRLIRQHLVQRQADGEEFISEPWPGSNKARPMDRSSWGWHETFTDQQLLERTRAVFAAALRIYTSMVDNWFPAFASRLRLRRIVPVKLEGSLFVPKPPSRGRDWPYLTWWPRPLGEHEESHVAFELAVHDSSSEDSTRSAIETARQESLNRVGEFWRSTEALHISGSRPATELAHRWLITELRGIGWTDLHWVPTG